LPSGATSWRRRCARHSSPDFSQVVVERTNPSLWERAKKTETRHADMHGFRTIADLMTAFNSLTGKLYLEGLQMTRPPKEAYSILFGKYPHPQTVVPGGVTTTVSLQVLNETLLRITRTLDYAKRGVFIFDDLTEFFYDADPRYKQVGSRAKITVFHRSFEYFYSRIQYFRSELPGRQEKDEEKYVSGYVVPPEAAYGKHYAQWLPDRRAEEAKKRGIYQREGLTPQVDGLETPVHDDHE
jgi:coenzyme F420-reducing hydrogenase alpha subunit